MPALSLNGTLSVPNVAFVLGVQAYFTVPAVAAPGPLSAEHATLLVVVKVAVYLASVNVSPAQPVRVLI